MLATCLQLWRHSGGDTVLIRSFFLPFASARRAVGLGHLGLGLLERSFRPLAGAGGRVSMERLEFVLLREIRVLLWRRGGPQLAYDK